MLENERNCRQVWKQCLIRVAQHFEGFEWVKIGFLPRLSQTKNVVLFSEIDVDEKLWLFSFRNSLFFSVVLKSYITFWLRRKILKFLSHERLYEERNISFFSEKYVRCIYFPSTSIFPPHNFTEQQIFKKVCEDCCLVWPSLRMTLQKRN